MYTSGQQTPKLLSPVSLLRTTEDEMVGWHHRLGGHEFEQAPGFGDGQGSLVFCNPWDRKELDTTEQLNNTNHLSNNPTDSALHPCRTLWLPCG